MPRGLQSAGTARSALSGMTRDAAPIGWRISTPPGARAEKLMDRMPSARQPSCRFEAELCVRRQIGLKELRRVEPQADERNHARDASGGEAHCACELRELPGIAAPALSP